MDVVENETQFNSPSCKYPQGDGQRILDKHIPRTDAMHVLSVCKICSGEVHASGPSCTVTIEHNT